MVLNNKEIAEIRMNAWKQGFIAGFGSAVAGILLFQILKFVLTL